MVTHAVQPSPILYNLKSVELNKVLSIINYRHLMKVLSTGTVLHVHAILCIIYTAHHVRWYSCEIGLKVKELCIVHVPVHSIITCTCKFIF